MNLPKAHSEVLERFIGDSRKRKEDFELLALTGLAKWPSSGYVLCGFSKFKDLPDNAKRSVRWFESRSGTVYPVPIMDFLLRPILFN